MLIDIKPEILHKLLQAANEQWGDGVIHWCDQASKHPEFLEWMKRKYQGEPWIDEWVRNQRPNSEPLVRCYNRAEEPRMQADLIKSVTIDLYRGLGVLVNGVEPTGSLDFDEGEDEGEIILNTLFTLPDGEITLTSIKGEWSCEGMPETGTPVVLTCSDGSQCTLTLKHAMTGDPYSGLGELDVPWGDGERIIDETHLYMHADKTESLGYFW